MLLLAVNSQNFLFFLQYQLKVAEFPKLALKHGILLNLPI